MFPQEISKKWTYFYLKNVNLNNESSKDIKTEFRLFNSPLTKVELDISLKSIFEKYHNDFIAFVITDKKSNKDLVLINKKDGSISSYGKNSRMFYRALVNGEITSKKWVSEHSLLLTIQYTSKEFIFLLDLKNNSAKFITQGRLRSMIKFPHIQKILFKADKLLLSANYDGTELKVKSFLAGNKKLIKLNSGKMYIANL